MNKKEVLKWKKKEDLNDKVICGIDCSSTVCGWSFIKNGELIGYGYHLFNSDDDIARRAIDFKKTVFENNLKGSADYFILEDRLKTHGRTTAQTLMMLAHINGNVEVTLKEYLGHDKVLLLHPSTVRSLAWGRPYPKDKSINTKDWIITNVMNRFDIKRGDFGFELKTRSKQEPKPFKDWTGDICDSITLSLSLTP